MTSIEILYGNLAVNDLLKYFPIVKENLEIFSLYRHLYRHMWE